MIAAITPPSPGTTARATRRALLAGLALALAMAPAWAGKPPVQAPEPPALPAATDARGLYAALDEQARKRIDEEQRVVTFGEQRRETAGGVQMLAVSLGVLRLPPDAVRSLLEKTSGYPGWIPLQPSYKSARLQGASRLVVGVGSADTPKAKRTMIYEVSSSGDVTTWRVIESGTALEPGSSVSFEVVPHPALEGASLVIHRQVGLLPASGRMTRYLSDDDDKGQNHWWKDANRHARRIHWAFDAALRFPPGADRGGLYMEHYQREFGGKVPYWATEN